MTGSFSALVGAAVAAVAAAAAQAPSPQDRPADPAAGQAVYERACASCHDAAAADRMPSRAEMRRMRPEGIVRALESGAMQEQAAALDADERRLVAEYLTGRSLEADAGSPAANRCGDTPRPFSVAGPGWSGWSPGIENTRLQPAAGAALARDQVPGLALKWAFGFPGAAVFNAQPTVIGGRLFVPAPNRIVYALDAASGCEHWTFRPDASVRTAISVAVPAGSSSALAFFGDGRANVYALDAATGALVWKTRLDAHPRASVVGAPVYFEGRLFVPIAAAEEGLTLDQRYECCTGRGALAALDAAAGRLLWKTYTIDDEARPVGRTAAGTTRWGPSGASIWSAPTIDRERGVIYAGTGNNFSRPATARSDAVVAFDMATGRIVWAKQLSADDVWNNACLGGQANCPENAGPDHDIASPPILVRLANGRRMLLAGQKSAVAWGLDPDRQGEVVWRTPLGRGGVYGGIMFGPASDGEKLYVAVGDMAVADAGSGNGRRAVDPAAGGGLHALDPATGRIVWSAPPPRCHRPDCSPAQPAALTVIPGVVFSGSLDGWLRAHATDDGRVIWAFDTAREFATVNGAPAGGGSLSGPGPAVAGGMLYVGSGFRWGMPGNVLLAFAVR